MTHPSKAYQRAQDLDRADPLAGFTDRFVVSDGAIYLDGNSLGRLPVETIRRNREVLEEQWGSRLIRSWNESWMGMPRRIAGKIARLVGAQEDEILVGDSTTLNLFKLAFSALRHQSGRTTIVTDDLNFPTDLYVLQGLVDQHFPKHTLSVAQSDRDGIRMEEDIIREQLNEDTALLSLSLVAYKGAFMYDMDRINRIAKNAGALTLWDLSHAAGAVPVDLNGSGADMAVGCTYKYLNGGPGAPAFLYVRKDLQKSLNNPVWGWFGHDRPFEFSPEFSPAGNIQRFGVGTPSILSLAAIEPGVDLLLEAGMDRIREKSILQSEYLMQMLREQLVPLGFEIASPLETERRGSHISIRHPEGYRINKAMIEPYDGYRPIIPDFRPPDNIRLGIAPLYVSYTDLCDAVERIRLIVETKEFERFDTKVDGVT